MHRTQRKWRAIGILFGLVGLIALLAGGFWLIQTVPAARRLVFGDPPTATPLPSPPATVRPAPSTPAEASPTLPSATGLPSTATAEPPAPEWIAFESKQADRSDYEILAVQPDGSRLVNLTNSWADDVAPVWSPDGRRIAFVSLRDTTAGKWGLGPGSLYLLDFDPVAGARVGEVVRLTDPDTNDGWPTWSPDGQRIAFESDRSGNWEIWAVNVDGSGLQPLTDHPSQDRFPAWSPDGTAIAFTSDRGGNMDVWRMNADGAQPVNLTQTPGRDRYAMWSPDGREIAFNTARDGDQEIYTMNADGSNPTNLSRSPDSIEGLADWSPDGQRLVLYSNRTGDKKLYIVERASGAWTQLTFQPSSDEFCTWSPRQ